MRPALLGWAFCTRTCGPAFRTLGPGCFLRSIRNCQRLMSALGSELRTGWGCFYMLWHLNKLWPMTLTEKPPSKSEYLLFLFYFVLCAGDGAQGPQHTKRSFYHWLQPETSILTFKLWLCMSLQLFAFAVEWLTLRTGPSVLWQPWGLAAWVQLEFIIWQGHLTTEITTRAHDSECTEVLIVALFKTDLNPLWPLTPQSEERWSSDAIKEKPAFEFWLSSFELYRRILW